MNYLSKIKAVTSIVQARLFNSKFPLGVRWDLTNRCDHRCSYCNEWNTPMNELSTRQVFRIIEELSDRGAQQVSFSGGEPLLRDDIGAIIDHCRNAGIMPTMNSRGALMDSRINEIRNLYHLKVSIDGPEEIHDSVTNKRGGFRQALRAVELAKGSGIKVTLATTITRNNIDHLDYILKIAEQYDTVVAFQPVMKLDGGVEEMTGIYPEKDVYRKRIASLIDLKKRGNRHMRNSLTGLEYISHWPDYPPLECAAGRLFCDIDTEGNLYPCDRVRYSSPLPNCVEMGFHKAFNALPVPECNGCGYCGTLELSYLLSFEPGIIKTVWDLTK